MPPTKKNGDKIIGIDLGTTNSVVALLEGDEPTVIPNVEGALKTPSVVYIAPDGKVLVGEMARRMLATQPERTIYSAKRLIGQYHSDIGPTLEGASFHIVPDDNDAVMVQVDDKMYRPEQISAMVLEKLKRDAEAYLGEPVAQAIITVPASFDDLQRTATKEAGKLAGLDVLRLVNEPTAAAMAYGLGKGNDGLTAVFDFGGGTFDITLMEITGRTFEVVVSEGDSQLGGDDFDALLAELVVEDIKRDYGLDLAADQASMVRIKEAVEKAKCELSSVRQANVSLPFLAQVDGQTVNYERAITRAEFEQLAEPLVNRAIDCCERALRAARLEAADVKRVLLVGGTTRIPLVQELVEDFFGMLPHKGVNPDEIVALGAATQAGVLAGDLAEVVLLDVTPKSLGIETRDDGYSVIIEKNSTIPLKKAKTFTTTEDRQEIVNIHVLQGEEVHASGNLSLGKFFLKEIKPAAAGVARIRVTFFINADGILEISAQDMGSGIERQLTIGHAFLNEDERRAKSAALGRRAAARRGRRAGGRRGGTVDTSVKPARSGVRTPAPGRRPAADSSGDRSPIPNSPTSSPGLIHRPSSGETFALVEDAAQDAGPQHTPPAATRRSVGPITAPPTEEEMADPKVAGHPLLEDSPPAVAPPPTRQAGGRAKTAEARGPIASAPPPAQPRAAPPATPPPATPPPAPPAAAPPRQPSREIAELMESPGAAPPATPPADPAPRRKSKSGVETEPEWSTRELVDDLLASPIIASEEVAASPTRKAPPVEKCPATKIGDSVRLAFTLVDSEKFDASAVSCYNDAMPRLENLAAEHPGDSSLQRYACLMALYCGEAEKALGYYRAYRGLSDWKPVEAVKLLGKIIERFPSAMEARQLRAELYSEQSKFEGAIKDLEFILNRQSHHEETIRRLEEVYKRLLEVRYSPVVDLKLVKIMLRANKIDEAIKRLQNIVEDPQFRTRAQKVLGFCYWQKQMYYPAYLQFKNLELNDEIQDTIYRLSCDMEARGDQSHALEAFEFLNGHAPKFRDVADRIVRLQSQVAASRGPVSPLAGGGPLGERPPASSYDVLKGSRFIILEELNRGSMGIVYKAKDQTLNEIVALKVLNDYLCTDPLAIERFKREARAAKKLTHERIVRIHDLFEINSKTFISMEYIEGEDLKRILQMRKKLTSADAAQIGSDVCDALEYAHKRGVIHRDIKPANIIIVSMNPIEMKVADFGIAKQLNADDMTTGSRIMGTPLYMAPEQIEGRQVDARSDIYSLGIMMYEMVAGNAPFCEGNVEYQHIHMDPPPLPAFVDDRVAKVIMRCISKRKEERFQAASEVVKALQPLLKHP